MAIKIIQEVQKTLLKKEKMLVTNIFSFSHNVFKNLLLQGPQKLGLCGKGLKSSCKGYGALSWVGFKTMAIKCKLQLEEQSWLFSAWTRPHYKTLDLQLAHIVLGHDPQWNQLHKTYLSLYQTTKFRLVKIESIWRRQNKCYWKLQICF